MAMLKCPNCGQVYNEDSTYYCFRCNVKLQPINQVTEVRNPQLADVSNRVIGSIDVTPIITCPYCKSTNCKKISGLSKAGSVFMWGIFALGKTMKEWHCNNCNSDF